MTSMIRSVLIANRGEIAVRIIQACQAAGMKTVQAYSSADADSTAVKMADAAICIGGPKPADSYLNAGNLLQAAADARVDAVHPGYGFLSENADFAEQIHRAGLVYVGPQPEIIRMMGDKLRARHCAIKAGVPVIPGTDEIIANESQAMAFARKTGYPLLIKAVAGGGGRGMRVVTNDEDLKKHLPAAMSEAQTAFGSSQVYMEKFFRRIRHVEVQVFGDGHEVIHLGDRDCSIQRRHQKLVEEGPAATLGEDARQKMLQAAKDLAKFIGYRNAGTVEFVVDLDTGNFYFIEMNTRIQVEHPVTEMLTGIDLVGMQLTVAGGAPLPVKQSDVYMNGHAIEVRINAENPAKAFIPNAGRITRFLMPSGPGIRVDTHVYEGYEASPYYDSLLAKLIVHGKDRNHAIERLAHALMETEIEGITTTLDFHQKLLKENDFLENNIHTRFIKEHMYKKHPMNQLL